MDRHNGYDRARSGRSNGDTRLPVHLASQNTSIYDRCTSPHIPTGDGPSLAQQREWHQAWQRALGPGTPPPRQPWDPYPADHQEPDQHVPSMRDQQPSHWHRRASSHAQATLGQRNRQTNEQALRDENEDSRQGRSYRHFRDLELQRYQEVMHDLSLMYNRATINQDEQHAAPQGRQVDHRPHLDELRYEARPASRQQQHQQQRSHQLTTRQDHQPAPIVDPYTGAETWTDTRAPLVDNPWLSAGSQRTRRMLPYTRRVSYRHYPAPRARMIPNNPISWIPIPVPYTLSAYPPAPAGNEPSRDQHWASEPNEPGPVDEPRGQRPEQEKEEEEEHRRALTELRRLIQMAGSWHERTVDHVAQMAAMFGGSGARRASERGRSRTQRERERQDEDEAEEEEERGLRSPRAERAHPRGKVDMSWNLATRQQLARVNARVDRQLALEVERERLREYIQREEEKEEEERGKRKRRKKQQQKEDKYKVKVEDEEEEEGPSNQDDRE